jgi:hypothetical protein
MVLVVGQSFVGYGGITVVATEVGRVEWSSE